MSQKIWRFFKDETVLCISGILAVLSCFLVPPDKEYLDYINLETLGVLFCLMAVMAGFQKLGVFEKLAHALLGRLRSQRSLVFTLIALCFLSAMFITNDVALITFVPLAILILDMQKREDLLCLTVALMTIAANMGSILTPIGNPQNLYIYSESGLGLGEFILITLPYAALAGALLAAAAFVTVKKTPVELKIKDETPKLSKFDLIYYSVLFLICILTVAKLIPLAVLMPLIVIAVAVRDWRLLGMVDYALLLTFLFFFVFIGNMGRFQPFKSAVLSVLEGHVLIVSTLLSQVISNVPAALLLGGFTTEWRELLVGVNLGGLGTLIASMASLISFKHLSRRAPEKKGKYLAVFTAWSLAFLAPLLLLSLFI